MITALPGSLCLIQGQSGVPNRAARSGHDSGKKCVWMSVTGISFSIRKLRATSSRLARMNFRRNWDKRATFRSDRTARTAEAGLSRCSSKALRRDAPGDGIFRSTIRRRLSRHSGRGISTTRPIVPGARRCGECRMCFGSRKISPSLIGISMGGLPGCSITRMKMSPFS